MDSVTEFAKMLKERENIEAPSIIMGKVLSPMPDLEVRLNSVIVLTKKHLILSDLAYNKTLIVGDEVILLPDKNEQTYYLLDKARRL